ncbi:MAG: prolipoprotein diacylglyceryl transferase [Spirochaetaceae bacterium]|nr:prolipoprotein diacylglyceryl transferase [Spirochaetaceae bacterium]
MLSFINYPSWLKPEIFPVLPVRWYGLMYIVAFAIAYFLVKKQIKEKDLKTTDDTLTNIFSWGILGILLGARIFYALVYDKSGQYWESPHLIFWPFDSNFHFIGLQGMSYHGGLIGGFVAVAIYCKIKNFNLLETGDLIAVAIPAGYTFGRLGNFANGELYGRVTTAPWGMIFPDAAPFSIRENWVLEIAAKAGIDISTISAYVNLPRHPSQLYEAFLEGIVLWAFLWFVMRKIKLPPGALIGSYITGYGFVRFFIEYFREPDYKIGFILKLSSKPGYIYKLDSFLNFTMGQILCFLMIACGLLFILFSYKRQAKQQTAELLGKEKKSYKKQLLKKRK